MPADDPLAGYTAIIDQVVDWGDMDSFGHVNNVVYFRYFENVRVEFLRLIGWWDLLKETGIGPIVASTDARFRRPVKWPETLRCGAKVIAISNDRFTMHHRLVSTTTGELTTEGEALVVSFDYREGKKVPLPESIRSRLVTLS